MSALAVVAFLSWVVFISAVAFLAYYLCAALDRDADTDYRRRDE